MVEYEAPDELSQRIIDLNALPSDWAQREVDTQQLGDEWLDEVKESLLIVPSVIMSLDEVPDRNVLINHRHPDVSRINIMRVIAFTLDPLSLPSIPSVLKTEMRHFTGSTGDEDDVLSTG